MDFLKQAYIGLNDGWRYAVGIILVIAGYGIFGQIPMMTALGIQVDKGIVTPAELKAFGDTNDFKLIDISSNLGFLLMICIFAFAALGMYVALKIHRKTFRDIITARQKFDWKRFFYGFAIWFVLSVLAEYILYMFDNENYKLTFNWESFFPLVIISLFFLPIQTFMEEIFFRGYISQGIYSVTKKPIAALVISTLLFSSVHSMNPEIAKFGFIPMQVYYLSAGFFLAFLAYLDDGLELSIGIHQATNFFGATCVTYEGAVLQTDTIFKMKETNPWLMTFSFLLAAALFLLIAGKKYSWDFSGQSKNIV